MNVALRIVISWFILRSLHERQNATASDVQEPSGAVLLFTEAGTARVLLDFVIARAQDLTPGEFVWRSSQLLADRQIHTGISLPGTKDAYYFRLGFLPRADGTCTLEVAR